MQHSRGKSALVFCSTRKGAQEAAQCLSQTAGSLGYSNPFMKSMQQYEHLREASLTCNDKQLQSCIVHGGHVESCHLCTLDLARFKKWFSYYCLDTHVRYCPNLHWRNRISKFQLVFIMVVFVQRIGVLLRGFSWRVIYKFYARQILWHRASTYLHIQ